MSIHLLPPVDDVLREVEPPDRGPPHDRVVSWRGVGHLHGAELEEALAEGDAAQEQLPELIKEKNLSVPKNE